MKRKVLLESYFVPGDPNARIDEFIEHHDTVRYHESLNNLAPEDAYSDHGQTILNQRQRIKQQTLAEQGRLYYKGEAA
jgi:putative transposase